MFLGHILKLNSPGVSLPPIPPSISSLISPLAFVYLLFTHNSPLLLSLFSSEMRAGPAAVCHHYNFPVGYRALVRRDFAWIITRLDPRLVSKRRRVTDFEWAIHKGTSRNAHRPRAKLPFFPPSAEPWIWTNSKMIPPALPYTLRHLQRCLWPTFNFVLYTLCWLWQERQISDDRRYVELEPLFGYETSEFSEDGKKLRQDIR